MRGAQDEHPHVRRQPTPSTVSTPPLIEAPEKTAREVKECVEAAGYQWDEPSYAFLYDIEASDQGKVLKVKLRDTTLRYAPLEACIERALAAMEVPEDALRRRASNAVSVGQSRSSYSRATIGVVQAAAAPIALAPILIPALGVTIIVAISLDIVRKATSGPDCKQVKQECITYCSDTTLPTPDFGWKFQKCKNECLERHGCPRDS